MNNGEPYRCYICGEPLEDDNASLEHIVLNGIGGKLRSKTLLCKTCNGELGHKSDVALSESLSFYTDMLQVKKDRDNGHKQVMKDEDGHEIIVEDGGRKLKLRKPYYEKKEEGNEKVYNLTAINEEGLKDYLAGQVRAKELTQAQMDEVMAKAKMKPHRPRLSTRTAIPQEAFPSIVRSAVNYCIMKTRRYDDDNYLRNSDVFEIVGKEGSLRVVGRCLYMCRVNVLESFLGLSVSKYLFHLSS